MMLDRRATQALNEAGESEMVIRGSDARFEQVTLSALGPPCFPASSPPPA